MGNWGDVVIMANDAVRRAQAEDERRTRAARDVVKQRLTDMFHGVDVEFPSGGDTWYGGAVIVGGMELRYYMFDPPLLEYSDICPECGDVFGECFFTEILQLGKYLASITLRCDKCGWSDNDN